ncbi:dual specificity protein phosphatase 19 isoform X2 [Grus americana]|uniref:dual specificity protein phosphatase 19 isoform X2 n=1 Tax=Grus americana TaxID=9117 RepID=UPI002407E551|nr:dual specificity protein phosphatase 19 isoform X2 [Grus americana]
MHSLTQEIRGFSRANLRKQRTRVTTLTGRRIIETWRGACLQVEEEDAAAPGVGYVQDLSADLQVGVVKPWLLLGSQDAAHDLETLRKYKTDGCLRASPEAETPCCKTHGCLEAFRGRGCCVVAVCVSVSGAKQRSLALRGPVNREKQSSSSKSVPNFGLFTLLCYSNGVIRPSDSGASAGQGVHQSGIWCHLNVTAL